jgi:hypothetical protein
MTNEEKIEFICDHIILFKASIKEVEDDFDIKLKIKSLLKTQKPSESELIELDSDFNNYENEKTKLLNKCNIVLEALELLLSKIHNETLKS